MPLVVRHELSKHITISRGHGIYIISFYMTIIIYLLLTWFCHFPVQENVHKVCCSIFVCIV